MSVIFRLLLFGASALTAIYIQRKLKKAQMQIADAAFWIVFSAILIAMSIWPSAVIWFSEKVGIISPVNFIFLVMIFLLFIRCFILSVSVSNLENKFNILVEELTVKENMLAQLKDNADHDNN